MFSREAANTNSIDFSLTKPGLESMIYLTRGEHANHYTTDVVTPKEEICSTHYFGRGLKIRMCQNRATRWPTLASVS
jgi:hypothetical protein